ncbi:MAG TPA: hypothetical protein VHB21_17825, partial [Minicystis sp.]|nr:hypothetical protein [Minicystis sp.]
MRSVLLALAALPALAGCQNKPAPLPPADAQIALKTAVAATWTIDEGQRYRILFAGCANAPSCA